VTKYLAVVTFAVALEVSQIVCLVFTRIVLQRMLTQLMVKQGVTFVTSATLLALVSNQV
jgi:hypothetical protein